MGKKDVQFAVNSLVFAKVKGYPAWPAKVRLKFVREITTTIEAFVLESRNRDLA